MSASPLRHEHDPPGIATGWRVVALIVVTVVLLAGVAIASGGIEMIDGSARSGSLTPSAVDPSGPSTEYLLLLAGVGGIGVMLLLAYVFLGASWSTKRGASIHAESVRFPPWLGPILIVAVAALPLAVVLWGTSDEASPPSVGAGPAPGFPAGSLASNEARATDGPTVMPVVVVLGTAIAATALAFALRSKRQRERGPTDPRRRAEMAAALDWTIDGLRRDPDPRHAVISAYARMEHELSRQGWARRPSRAPFEYVEEALRELALPPAPARSLTKLFELARFSRHPVDASMKDRAIDALVELRNALRVERS